MPATYEPLATTTLGSSAANITFSSISGSYTDLRLVLTGTPTGNASVLCRLNSDTGANYSRTYLFGSGSSASAGQPTGTSYMNLLNFSTAQPCMITLDFFSYANTTTNKAILSTYSGELNTSGNVEIATHTWQSTAAITTILLYLGGTNFAAGTTATLYGILKA